MVSELHCLWTRPPKKVQDGKDLFWGKATRLKAPSFHDDFVDFIAALNRHDVRYVLVGGYAVVTHGYSRNTGDLDVWINPTSKNYQKLQKSFNEFGLPISAIPIEKFLDEKYDVYSFGRSPIAIDIMTKVKGLSFDEVFKSAVWVDIGKSVQVKVVSLKDLIKAKKASGRYKDLDDIEHLTKDEE